MHHRGPGQGIDAPSAPREDEPKTKRRNSLGHMALRGSTGERFISHRATRFGKDSNHGAALTNYQL
ncbi:hypothetical protein E2C01_021864 [Portunus trituberculatus]|uniref:Uncharacterized protein n=1 Tax=Portunus trituberculatus TaxID=210409 RepID=A0A5B7E7E0_PORTR|nr:hypothetical protein [Portunus trituberculatus]